MKMCEMLKIRKNNTPPPPKKKEVKRLIFQVTDREVKGFSSVIKFIKHVVLGWCFFFSLLGWGGVLASKAVSDTL